MIGTLPVGDCAIAILARRNNQQTNEVAYFIWVPFSTTSG
jgi:hypothetical protein